ncbi:MAG: DUF3365 domain-containing protein [Nitrospira sp.]|nr:DUF3365 domain-containing protein [Nitrospira sp.]
MRRRLPWMVVSLLAGWALTAGPAIFGGEQPERSSIPFQTVLELEHTARLLAVLLDSGRAVINDNQILLDESQGRGLTPEAFERQLLDMFRGRAGIDLHELDHTALAPRTKRLLRALVETSRQVIADVHRKLRPQPNEFTGFIPAAFGARVSARFTEQTGVRLKQTALAPRNPANRPDAYEQGALEAFADAAYPRETVISEMAANSASFRLMFPLYATRHCLDCHGEPKGGVDRLGYPREGLVLGQNAGAISVILPVKP